MHDEIVITVIATGFEDRPADILSPSRDKAEAHAKEEEGAESTSQENADNQPRDDIFQSKVTGAFDIPSFLSKDKMGSF
jgi:cell division GTPase FtsZ